MIIKEFPNKQFQNKEEAIKYLIENKNVVIAQKKGEKKLADALPYVGSSQSKDGATKEEGATIENATNLKVVAVSNACNYFDSHRDVSINGSWNRTAKNTKNGLHLQEHRMKFDSLISENVHFKVETKTWKDLGFEYEGSAECLVMYSELEKETNPYMFEMYAKGKIKNHSAGLRYVNIVLCVNNSAEWAKDEKEAWDKYYPHVVNKDDVDDVGYFWAILEQKIIENSAVLRGSNPATPTISVELADSTSTKQTDSAEATPKQSKMLNLNLF